MLKSPLERSHMRLPRGFGSITKERHGNRYRPWRARITIGTKLVPIQTGRIKRIQIFKNVGYFRTKQEALQALYEVNPGPIQSVAKKEPQITLLELYTRWSETHFDNLAPTTISLYHTCINAMSDLVYCPINIITSKQLQHFVDQSRLNKPMLSRIVILLKQLFKYAVNNEYLPPSSERIPYTLNLNHKKNPNQRKHIIFTEDELALLWKIPISTESCFILVMLYTGVRIGELLSLKKTEVHLHERYFEILKSKTEAGVRKVPICDKIAPFIAGLLDLPGDYLVCNRKQQKYNYVNFLNQLWHPELKRLGVGYHTPHDTRHSFISMLAEKEVDERVIRAIVGHAGNGVTESVYTHIRLKTMLEAVNKL